MKLNNYQHSRRLRTNQLVRKGTYRCNKIDRLINHPPKFKVDQDNKANSHANKHVTDTLSGYKYVFYHDTSTYHDPTCSYFRGICSDNYSGTNSLPHNPKLCSACGQKLLLRKGLGNPSNKELNRAVELFNKFDASTNQLRKLIDDNSAKLKLTINGFKITVNDDSWILTIDSSTGERKLLHNNSVVRGPRKFIVSGYHPKGVNQDNFFVNAVKIIIECAWDDHLCLISKDKNSIAKCDHESIKEANVEYNEKSIREPEGIIASQVPTEYIVLDLEWNCTEKKRDRVKSPVVLNGEIIQIGAVKLNSVLEEIDQFTALVKPIYYPHMNKTVEELTSITDADLETGRPFTEVIEEFRQWCGKDSIMFTWSPSDVPILVENLTMYGMDEDWIPEDFDAQLMFDVQETMEGRNFSLDYAFYYFDLRGVKAHDALNDARDTAAVIRLLDPVTFVNEEREYRLTQKA